MEEHRSGYRQCQICSSSRRINIDREIIKGTTYAAISRTYQVSRYTVSNHAMNHLSHQLMRAHNTQDALGAESLISDFQFLISKTKEILAQAEEKQWLNTGLAAIRELRSCWESWVKIGANIMTYKESQHLREIEREKAELQTLPREELERLAKDLEEKERQEEEKAQLRSQRKRELRDGAFDSPPDEEFPGIPVGVDDELIEALTVEGRPGDTPAPAVDLEETPAPAEDFEFEIPTQARKTRHLLLDPVQAPAFEFEIPSPTPPPAVEFGTRKKRVPLKSPAL